MKATQAAHFSYCARLFRAIAAASIMNPAFNGDHGATRLM
jgi:hypothetical protein